MRQSEAKASGMLGSTNQHTSRLEQVPVSCTVETMGVLRSTSEHSVRLLDNLVKDLDYILRPVEAVLVKEIPIPKDISPIEVSLSSVVNNLDAACLRANYILEGLHSLSVERRERDSTGGRLVDMEDNIFQSADSLSVDALLMCISNGIRQLGDCIDLILVRLKPFLSESLLDTISELPIEEGRPMVAVTLSTLAVDLANRVNHPLIRTISTLHA